MADLPPHGCVHCAELAAIVERLRTDVVLVRVRLGWLFGGLAALGVLEVFPR